MWTSDAHQPDRTRLLRLAFLSAFLGDEDAGVRHRVAVSLAYVLGLPNESTGNWMEKQWGELYKIIRTKLSLETLTELRTRTGKPEISR